MSRFGRDLDALYVLAKRAAALGALVAVICHFLPPQYRTPCTKVAHICKGG